MWRRVEESVELGEQTGRDSSDELAADVPLSKRNLLAQGLSETRILRLLENFAPRRRLVALAYHRIGSPAGCSFDRGQYSATAEGFERQMRYLRDRYRILGLEEVVAMADGGLEVDEPCALVTFDDGYRDNFVTAFPILEELGITATFFVPSTYLERPRLPWWDRIHYVLRRTSRASVTLEIGGTRLSLDLEGEERKKAISRVLGAFKRAGGIDEEQFFAQLEERAETSVDAEALGRELFASWGNLREMIARGMTVGAHTHSHRILAGLPLEVQREELVQSKCLLEEKLEQPIVALAYPVGRADAFDAKTKQLAREVGYKVGFSFYGGINRAGARDFMDLRRVRVERSDSLELLRCRLAADSLSSLVAGPVALR